jgi:adenylate kinase family enzyme
MRELIIVRGLPGSGKSTLAKRLLATYALGVLHTNTPAYHYEADQYFTDEDGNYNWDGMQIGDAHAWCQAMCWQRLEEGATVIVSNTFTTKKEIQPYFDMIQQHGQNPTVVLAQSNFGSVHGVPDNVLQNMKNRFLFNLDDLFVKF